MSHLIELPSGRVASVKTYSAGAAKAMADHSLLRQGMAVHKALAYCIETIDGETWPRWGQNQQAAMKAADDLLLGDFLHILFMAVAHYHDGTFVGDVLLPDGSLERVTIPLLEDDGQPVPQFRPNRYPLGAETRVEWDEEIEGIGSVGFAFRLLTGQTFRKIDDTGNQMAQFDARRPQWTNPESGTLELVDTSRPNLPHWVTRAIGRKIREVDPVIQYSAPVWSRGVQHRVSMMGQQGFFLQDFQ